MLRIFIPPLEHAGAEAAEWNQLFPEASLTGVCSGQARGTLSSGNELKQKNGCEKPQSSEITDQGAHEDDAATEGGREWLTRKGV